MVSKQIIRCNFCEKKLNIHLSIRKYHPSAKLSVVTNLTDERLEPGSLSDLLSASSSVAPAAPAASPAAPAAPAWPGWITRSR